MNRRTFCGLFAALVVAPWRAVVHTDLSGLRTLALKRRKEIIDAYGLPPTQIGMMEEETYSNVLCRWRERPGAADQYRIITDYNPEPEEATVNLNNQEEE